MKRFVVVACGVLVLALLGVIAFVQVQEHRAAEAGREAATVADVQALGEAISNGQLHTVGATHVRRVFDSIGLSMDEYTAILAVSQGVALGDGKSRDVARALSARVWVATSLAEGRLTFVADEFRAVAADARRDLAEFLPPK